MNYQGLTYDLYDLMQMFTQHLMRYKLVFGSIQSYAEKSEMKQVERSARRAADLMSDLVKHVEKFVDDNQNLLDVKRLMDKISYKPSNFQSFGFLKNTLEIEKLKLQSSGKEFKNVTMLCFETKIVFYKEEGPVIKRIYITDMENRLLHPSMSK